MSGARRAYADTPLGQVHYRSAGEAANPPLVLLHQAPSSSAMWEPILPALADRGWRALAPDLIGHGASDGGRGSPTLDDYAAGVWAWLDALGISTTCLVGHHSGASISILMAVSQPARVRALALWGVPLMSAERSHRLATEQPPDWQRVPAWLPGWWEFRRRLTGPHWVPEQGRRAMLELLQAGPNSTALHNAVGSRPLEPLLPQVRQPLLAMCGEHDTLFPESERAAAVAPNARFRPLHGATIDVVDQQPQWFVEAVDTFLREATAGERQPQAPAAARTPG